ncbi:MAG: DegT/DnrJ/EryC1/StrS aminotransferase family protein [Burkholderiales bacterium]|nr:DegT/DnrJ/EryC1/StrS aminotransferase family protein [Flavobacterium sp.]
MFVLQPDPFLMPACRISPFQTADMEFNNNLPPNESAKDYLNRRFGAGNWQYTYNGREAIQLALESYNLDKNDLVTILTTSENFYISSCVTRQIEKFCCWNREILPETKILFVNHEFGYPHPGMEKLIQTGLPIIEDCCTTFFSQDSIENLGQYGDYAIYSFPKFFPMQLGGLLVSSRKKPLSKTSLKEEQIHYIQNIVSHYLIQENELLLQRKNNYEFSLSLFTSLGFTERFETNDATVPSSLLLHNNGVVKDLNALKLFFNRHGIQNSVFYGEDAFFIPSHQNLTESDIQYFFYCMQEFLKSNNTAL